MKLTWRTRQVAPEKPSRRTRWIDIYQISDQVNFDMKWMWRMHESSLIRGCPEKYLFYSVFPILLQFRSDKLCFAKQVLLEGGGGSQGPGDQLNITHIAYQVAPGKPERKTVVLMRFNPALYITYHLGIKV